MNAPHNAVVVGVSASGADAALAFAIGDAGRTQRPVHLVHVVELPSGDAYVGMYGGMLAKGKAALDAAQQEAAALAPTRYPCPPS